MESNLEDQNKIEKKIKVVFESIKENPEFEHLLETKINYESENISKNKSASILVYFKYALLILGLLPLVFIFSKLYVPQTNVTLAPTDMQDVKTEGNIATKSLANTVTTSKVFAGLSTKLVTGMFFDVEVEKCYQVCTKEDLLDNAVKQMDSLKSFKFVTGEKEDRMVVAYILLDYLSGSRIEYFNGENITKEMFLTKNLQYVREKIGDNWGEIEMSEGENKFTDLLDSFTYKKFFNPNEKITFTSVGENEQKNIKTLIFTQNDSECSFGINRSLVIVNINCRQGNGQLISAAFSDFNINPGNIGFKFTKEFGKVAPEKVLENVYKQINLVQKKDRSYSVYYKNTDINAPAQIIEGSHMGAGQNKLQVEYARYEIRGVDQYKDIQIYGDIKYEKISNDRGETWDKWKYVENKNGWSKNNFESLSTTEILNQYIDPKQKNWEIKNIIIEDTFSDNIKRIVFDINGKGVNADVTFKAILQINSDYNVTRIELVKYKSGEYLNTQTVDYWVFDTQEIPPRPIEPTFTLSEAKYICSTYRFLDNKKKTVKFLYPSTATLANQKTRISDCEFFVGYDNLSLYISRIDAISNYTPMGGLDDTYTLIGKPVNGNQIMRKYNGIEINSKENMHGYYYADTSGVIHFGHPNMIDQWTFSTSIPISMNTAKAQKILKIFDDIVLSFTESK